jgi:uncharacterized protein YbjT (DUF2867 family)
MAQGTIAVAGATGRVGRHVVEVLEEARRTVVPIARATGVDVITGEGLDDALAGAEAVVDAATGPSPEEEEATAFFTTAARNLQDAGTRAGVRRIVTVSIIGADRFAGGYGAACVAHERATLAGPVPARILRAAQFHEFVEQLVAWGRRGDVSRVPPMRTQLVAARTVAEALADLAMGAAGEGPAVSEIAGPREERLVDVATHFAERREPGLRVEEVSDPDDPFHALVAAGGLLPGPGATLAGPTFEAWLAALATAAAR